MELRKTITKKPFASEGDNCKEETDLTPKDRIGNINWCNYGY